MSVLIKPDTIRWAHHRNSGRYRVRCEENLMKKNIMMYNEEGGIK